MFGDLVPFKGAAFIETSEGVTRNLPPKGHNQPRKSWLLFAPLLKV